MDQPGYVWNRLLSEPQARAWSSWKGNLKRKLLMSLHPYSVHELFPRPVIIGDIAAGDGEVEELPLSLRLYHLAGKLRGSRRVGERDEPEFAD